MSDQDKLSQEPVGYTSRRQERGERRAARQADRQSGGLGWLAGVVLIAIGVLYMLYDYGVLPTFANWWALLLLLPAVGTLSAALGAFRRNGGHWTPDVTGPFVAGLLFLGLTAVFLFELNFGWVAPLFLIAAWLFLLFSPVLARH